MAPAQDETARATAGRRPNDLGGAGSLFVVLWAAAHVTHLVNQGVGSRDVPGSRILFGSAPITDPWYWAVLVTAVVVLHRPRSGLRLLVFAAAGVTAVAVQMPFVANHWFLAGIVNAGLLVAGWRQWRSGGGLTAERIVTAAAPFIRLALLLAYGAAAIAKLNHTFLDPSTSCAVFLTRNVVGFWGLSLPPSTAVETTVVVASAAVELAVPVLLLVRRTRMAGIALAGVFHYLTASTPLLTVMDFTAMLYALLVLFAPDEFAAAARRLTAAARRRLPPARRLFRARGVREVAAVGLIVAVGLRGAVLGPAFGPLAWIIVMLAWGAVLALGLWALVRTRRMRRRSAAPLIPSGIVNWLMIAVVIVTAASPYLGLRTVVTFTMFSNLRTEQGVSNHLVLPRLMLFELQDDFVEILETTDPLLTQAMRSQELVHELEVRRRLAADPDQPIHLRRDGEDVRLEPASDRPELVRIGWLEGKLLRYRNLAMSGTQPCRGI